MEIPFRGSSDWLDTVTVSRGRASTTTTRRTKSGDFHWPPAGTSTWPPVGTFSWPRTWAASKRLSGMLTGLLWMSCVSTKSLSTAYRSPVPLADMAGRTSEKDGSGTGRCSRRAVAPHQGNDSSCDGFTPRRTAPPRSQVGDPVAWHERGRRSDRRCCLDHPWTHEYVSAPSTRHRRPRRPRPSYPSQFRVDCEPSKLGGEGPTDTVPSTGVDYRSAGACGQVVGRGTAIAPVSVRALRASVRCGGGRV